MAIVETALGKVEGRDKKGHIAFTGIRYAEAPVGDLRFCPPVPVKSWKGEDGQQVLDATQFGPAAPQPKPINPAEQPEPWDEDCLFLNVYTPAADNKKRPVMVWIHGGAYVRGSGRIYNGRRFAGDHDVVLVTVNYRMGAFGYMHVGHLEEGLDQSVNNGLLDQICALEWVRDHIGVFGGDAGNVTIFGESAGGTAVAALLGSPKALPLFHKVIVHSPNVDMLPVGQGHIDFTNRCIEKLGGDPSVNGMETLRNASVEDLVKLSESGGDTHSREGSLGLRKVEKVWFSPAIDGTLIPRPVHETVERGETRSITLMGGGCRHEGTLFPETIGKGASSEAEARAFFEREGFDGARAMEVYETFAPGSTPREKLIYAITDTIFRNSMVRILDAAAEAGQPTYSWMFAYETDFGGGALRSTHALELFFLFDWAFLAPGGMGGSNPPQSLGEAMRAYWCSFARDGKPSAAGEPEWPAYDTGRRATMVLDAERRVEDDYDGVVRRYWFEEAEVGEAVG